MAVGNDRYNRMNVPSLAAGQGGSSAPMPLFGKATPGLNKMDLTGGFGQLIGIGESMFGNKLANDQTAKMEALYQKQIDAARPGNVTGGVYGNTNYNADTNTLDFSGNDQFTGMLSGLNNQISGYQGGLDPYQLAQKMYDLKTPGRDLFQNQQQKDLDERLNARGMGYSSSGNDMFRSLAQGQNLANDQEMSGNFQLGQEMANAENARYQNALAAINTINTGVNNQNTNATNMGVNVAPPAGVASAYENQMNTQAATGSALGDVLGIAGTALAGPLGGMFGSAVGSFFG